MVLDAGCGARNKEKHFHTIRHDIHYVAFDIMNQNYSLPEHVSFHQHDLEIQPWHFEDNYSDAVFCSHVLEYIRNVRKFCDELKRVIKSGDINNLENKLINILKHKYNQNILSKLKLKA